MRTGRPTCPMSSSNSMSLMLTTHSLRRAWSWLSLRTSSMRRLCFSSLACSSSFNLTSSLFAFTSSRVCFSFLCASTKRWQLWWVGWLQEGSGKVEKKVAIPDARSGLTGDQIKKYEAVFREIDEDRSGFIDKTEMQACLKRLGAKATAKEARAALVRGSYEAAALPEGCSRVLIVDDCVDTGATMLAVADARSQGSGSGPDKEALERSAELLERALASRSDSHARAAPADIDAAGFSSPSARRLAACSCQLGEVRARLGSLTGEAASEVEERREYDRRVTDIVERWVDAEAKKAKPPPRPDEVQLCRDVA